MTDEQILDAWLLARAEFDYRIEQLRHLIGDQ